MASQHLAMESRPQVFGPIAGWAVDQPDALLCSQRDLELAERPLPMWSITLNAQHVEEGEKRRFWTGWKKKLKPDPVPAHKAQGYVRGMGAIIALPKNKRGKMTVEDTVTKSSSGQIGGPALWRVSHKRATTHSPPHTSTARSALPPIRFPLSARPHGGEGRRGLKCLSEAARLCPASMAHVRHAGSGTAHTHTETSLNTHTHSQTNRCRHA